MAGFAIGYRLPDDVLTGPPGVLLAAVRAADAAGVDYLVLPDRPAAPDEGVGPPAAVVTASWLATQTGRVGLVVTASPAYVEPYNLARALASLDHISAGRAGWLVVTGADGRSDANHRRDGFDPSSDRAARAAEYVPVVRDLWDSWEDGAFVHDKATGQFIEADRIHTIDHAGPALRVRGPLNVIRPPQGHPVVFAAAADPLVAPAADVLVTGEGHGGAAAAGGPGRAVHLAALAFVGPTGGQAAELHARAGAPRDQEELAVLTGDPLQVADQLRDRTGAGTGVIVRFADAEQLQLFTEHGLPRLRPGGPAEPSTLRERLGLPRPASRFAAAVTASGERG